MGTDAEVKDQETSDGIQESLGSQSQEIENREFSGH